MNKKIITDAFNKLPSEIKEAEIALEAQENYNFEVGNGGINNISYSNSEEYFVRVSNDSEGYYYTQDGSEDPYKMFIKAYENSLVSSVKRTSVYNRNYCDLSNNTKQYNLVDLKENVLKLYKDINNKIKEGNLYIEVIVRKTKMSTINNLSLDVDREFNTLILIAYLIGKDDSYPINVRGDIVLNSFEDNLDDFIDDLNERYQYQKKPISNFESGDYRVILHQNFVYVLMCTAWQLFSGKKYIEKATCFNDCLNTKVASECLSFIDDSIGFSFLNDCEGSICKDVSVVRNGKYIEPLLNNETSNILKINNNGCAGRKPLLFGNIATDIQITPRNFKVEKGNYSFEELKDKLNNGIIITEHFDIFHSLNIASGEFAIPCYGVKVENGKEVGNLRALVITGNIKDLLLNVEAISNRQMIRPMHYLNNYGIASSDLLVSKLKVTGE